MISEAAKQQRAIDRQKKGKVRAQSSFFRSARYGLSLQEHRIIYYAILVGQQTKKPFEPVTLSVKAFKQLCDLKGNSSYGVLRNISKKLLSRIVEIEYKDDEGLHLLQANWLTDVEYHIKTGTVTITPNKRLQPFFEGKPYSDTEYYYLIKFTSQYAERLYEIIKSFEYKPLIDFDIEDLRKRLGVPPTQYQNYNMFRTRVLSPAIRDINDFTDMSVTLEEKRGAYNKVVSVLFVIEKRPVPSLPARIAAGEFSPPLSEEEQELVLREMLEGDTLIGDKESEQIVIPGLEEASD